MMLAIHRPVGIQTISFRNLNRNLTNSLRTQRQQGRVFAQTTKIADMSMISKKDKKEKIKEDDIEGDGPGLTAQQVEELLNVLCEETEIAQVELKMPGFKMKVRRSLDGLASTASTAPAPVAPAVPAPAPAPVAISYDDESDSDLEDDSAALMPVKASKVGILRRGRYVKGKQIGKAPAAEEGANVRAGQTLCYIEQLGAFFPVEAPQAGELVSFSVKEGEPVEYNMELAEIAPFFGGHIIGDSKHA